MTVSGLRAHAGDDTGRTPACLAREAANNHYKLSVFPRGRTRRWEEMQLASTPSTWPHERLGKRPLPPRVNALSLTRDERRRRRNTRPQRERRNHWPMIGRPRVHRVVGRQRQLRRLFTRRPRDVQHPVRPRGHAHLLRRIISCTSLVELEGRREPYFTFKKVLSLIHI